MSETQTYTYDAATETVTTEDNLTPAEKESLLVGEEMESKEETLLAGKYKNAEELEKAHIELQKKLGEKSEEVSEEPEAKQEEEKEEPTESTENILDELWSKSKDNKLDQETFDRLSKMNPVEIAKLAMQQRQASEKNTPREFTEKDVEQIHGFVGGSDNYNNMMAWAQQNVPEQE